MNAYRLYSLLKPLTRLGIGLCCMGLAWYIRSPFVASIREILLYSMVAVLGLMLFLDAPLQSRRRGRFGSIRTVAFTFALTALLLLGMRQGVYFMQRAFVLKAVPEELRARGKFIISGYRDEREMERLIGRGGVAGVYITARNVRGRSKARVRKRIARFQEIARQAGLPPLIIAADQEGGVVNHLRSVLGPMPALAPMLEQSTKIPAKAVRKYAERQARGLLSLGVNVNFAPVLDLPQGPSDAGDGFSRIHDRALGRDPERVGRAALIYCEALRREGVMPVLKHFPGLGRVALDTHTRRVVNLDTDPARLSRHDWRPFRAVLSATPVMVMLGHVRLTAVDANKPASYSSAVVSILRHDWKHRGVIITDDFSMAPVAHGPHGAGPAAVLALRAGVDLILLAYDVELYYPVMNSLLRDLDVHEKQGHELRRAAQRLHALRKSFTREPRAGAGKSPGL